MPIINCPNCNQMYDVNSSIIGQKVHCAICNETFIAMSPTIYILQTQQSSTASSVPKSRTVYIVWGLFFGHIGFHDFYAELHLLGFIHLGLCFLSGFASIIAGKSCPGAMIMSYIWALVEIFVIKKDGKGLSMK